LPTIGFANPLRHLTGDGAYLATLLRTISGPTVLVGHSYGGAVMSNAAAGNEQVQALVFVAGWMPDEGESIQQLLESEVFADSLVPPGAPTGAVHEPGRERGGGPVPGS
jgi:pimeloyl-ACP methyl ester carboxylesterase